MDAQGKAIPVYGRLGNVTTKSTYQLSSKYRLVGFFTRETQYFPDPFRKLDGAVRVARACFTEARSKTRARFQGTPIQHLFVDAFAGHHLYRRTTIAQPGAAEHSGTADLTTGFTNGPNLGQDRRGRASEPGHLVADYIPSGSFLGSHELKVGSTYMYMWTGTNEPEGIHGNYQLVFQTVGGVPGTPVQIRFFNYPITENRENLIDGGFYVQDTWRIGNRVTTQRRLAARRVRHLDSRAE